MDTYIRIHTYTHTCIATHSSLLAKEYLFGCRVLTMTMKTYVWILMDLLAGRVMEIHRVTALYWIIQILQSLH